MKQYNIDLDKLARDAAAISPFSTTELIDKIMAATLLDIAWSLRRIEERMTND